MRLLSKVILKSFGKIRNAAFLLLLFMCVMAILGKEVCHHIDSKQVIKVALIAVPVEIHDGGVGRG